MRLFVGEVLKLSNHDNGIKLATYKNGGVIQGMGAGCLSNRGAGVALATCSHCKLFEGWELTCYPTMVPITRGKYAISTKGTGEHE